MRNTTQELRDALGKINAFTGVMQSIDTRMSEGQKLHLADAVDGVMRLYEHFEALSAPKSLAGAELRERVDLAALYWECAPHGPQTNELALKIWAHLRDCLSPPPSEEG